MCSTRSVSDESIVEKFRKEYNEQFHILVRMHLSFLLDCHTENNECFSERGKIKKWNLVQFGKKFKARGETQGVPLTQEGICQMYQLIEFLKKEQNLKSEGIFRRTGSLERQQELRNMLSQGLTLPLEGGTYSVHDCASVLKGYLAELPDPILTEAHFPVYCQIAELCGIVQQPTQEDKLLEALQLLLLLLPKENRDVLKDILDLLHLTASHESCNRMSPENLAKLFTPHLLCPRKLSPENLLKDSQTLFGIISFMIKRSPELFKIPSKIIVDFRAKYEKKKIMSPTKRLNESVTDAASTVFTFVDHERTAKENESNPTETALAQLYAHIQSMPESSKKRKLVKQFNKENGHGTPLQVIRSNMTKNKGLGDSIKKHIFQKGLAKKKGFSMLRSSSDEILDETMMTPRSRKPVLLLSGTSINTLHKVDPPPSCMMDNVAEELSENSPDIHNSLQPKLSFKKSKSDGDILSELKTQRVQKINTSNRSSSLTDTFKDYLSNRDMETLSSPADLSFSSRTDDFNSMDDFNSTDFNNISDNKMTESLLYCLNGNDPDEMDDDDDKGKELVLKPKQFDKNGKPIVFETSF